MTIVLFLVNKVCKKSNFTIKQILTENNFNIPETLIFRLEIVISYCIYC